MLRRSPWALVAAVSLALLLWLFQSGGLDTSTAPESSPSTANSTASDLPRGPSTMGPVVESADADGLPTVRERDLPAQAREVLDLIDAGGPFAHPEQDGSRFGNFEGILPQRPRGYYREYTVPTPGLDHRGARRIVTGEGGQAYWTADHYESFARILR